MLYATVRNRKIHVKKPDTVVQNGVKVDWLQLEMDDEWAEMDSIVCVFVARYTEEQAGDGGTKTLVEQEIKKEILHTFGQKVLVPWEVLVNSGMLSVSCTGYVGSEKIMTTMYPDSFWQIVQNGPKSGDSSIEPTASLYDQILAASGAANAAAIAATQAREQLLQDKANGVFDGEDGKAATVEVGTVITGSPEENAQVYATGTPQERRLNFVLPRGKQGPKGEVNPSEIAQAVENYMAAHPIQETDPTVPAWAKQPQKPAYTAAEVHALPDTYTPPVDATLTQSGQAADAAEVGTRLSSLSKEMLTDAELSNAVDNALARAKESGEFDGPKGDSGVGIRSVAQTTTSTEDGGTNVVTVTKTDGTTSTFSIKNGSKGSAGQAGADGHTPVKGTDYWTAEDQQAIVDGVLAALPTWEGGSY